MQGQAAISNQASSPVHPQPGGDSSLEAIKNLIENLDAWHDSHFKALKEIMSVHTIHNAMAEIIQILVQIS